MKTLAKRLGLLISATCATLALSAAAIAAPLYVSANGTMYVVDSTNGTISSSFTTGSAGPVAVGSTVKLFNGSQSHEYSLTGTPLGSTATDTGSGGFFDGTSDGVAYNYSMPNSSGSTTVYRYDLNWNNRTTLFTFSNSPEVFGLGIAYDLSDNTLWMANDVPGNDIKHFDLTGNLLGSFSFANGLGRPGALAYDQSTDSLWFLTESGNNLLQFSKTGTQINSFVVAGLSHWYSMEFANSGRGTDIPEPSTLALAGLALLFVARRRKNAR